MQHTENPTTDKEWADYLSGVLRRLGAFVEPLPEDAPMREYVEAAMDPLGALIGYLIGGICGPDDLPDDL